MSTEVGSFIDRKVKVSREACGRLERELHALLSSPLLGLDF
jgi:hypothetical protein